jgi:RNA polymerase subunit RPABC4/transcription elongation factor Spt4
MSDLIESIKQGAGQVLSDLDQKGQIKSAFEGLRHQWTEMDRRRRASLLANQIKTLESEAKQLTEALGLQTLSLFDTGKISNPELARLCERINQVRSDVDQKQAELSQLRAQAPAPRTVQCLQCHSSVAADAQFCPKCGAQLPIGASAAAAVPSTGAATPATGASPASSPNTPSAGSAGTPGTIVRMRCPKCKTMLPSDAGFCPTCGVKIRRPEAPADARFCPSCGAQANQGARFCPVCGAPLS